MRTPAASPLHVVVGAGGQLGRELVARLHAAGHRVRAVGRGPLVEVGPDAILRASGDIGDLADAERVCRDAAVVYGCVGAPHRRWLQEFPRMTRGLLHGARTAGAKLVFADNLYAYGPQRGVLVETLPATSFGRKPRLRAELATMLLDAHARGEARVVIARASDFHGPGVDNAMLGVSLVRAVVAGRRVFLPGDLDAPHTFTFVPDFARSLVELGLADDVAGQIWHVPSPPAISLRAAVERIAALAGKPARLHRIPGPLVEVGGWFDPALRELSELAFQWDRAYLVSHAKFVARFGERCTPFEDALGETLAWIHDHPPSSTS